MSVMNKLAVGLAVFAISGTALASDVSADRAAAAHRSMRAERMATAAPHAVATDAAPTRDHDCARMECCAMHAPAAQPAAARGQFTTPQSTTPTFTDAG